MLNRRKLFSFLATAPVATVIGAKAAMDANGNDVAPLIGDFPPPRQSPAVVARGDMVVEDDNYIMVFRSDGTREWFSKRPLFEQMAHNSRSQRFGS